MDGTNKCVEDGSTELVKMALSQSARNEVRSLCNGNACKKYFWNIKQITVHVPSSSIIFHITFFIQDGSLLDFLSN